AQHEAVVWREVVSRLRHTKTEEPNRVTDSIEGPVDSAVTDGELEPDYQGLQDISCLRRLVAEQTAIIAEEHRGAIWQRVQDRIRARAREAGLALAEPAWEGAELEPQAPLRPAHARGRLFGNIGGRLWPRLAASGAAAALLVAALGPAPATGLANHPVARVVRLVGDYVGVSETGAPPVVPSYADVVEGTDVSLSEASALLGQPVWEPTIIPPGFRQVSSTYYPQPLTAGEGGVFLLAYAGDVGLETASPPTILIYQERASGDDIAVLQGFALDRTLSDGTPATYVQGSWRTSGSQIVWGEDGAQSLVFDRAGLRTIIHSIDGAVMGPGDLQTIAESMRAVVTP
ncbi:MAG: hypothetical protein V3U26_01295, partial [Dehalococcoidia bacterium]